MNNSAKKKIGHLLLPLCALVLISLTAYALITYYDISFIKNCFTQIDTSTIVSETNQSEEVYEPLNIVCDEQTLFIGRSAYLVSDTNCTNWCCSDETVVSISDCGEVTALTVGDVDVSCSRPNGDTLNWHIKSRKLAYLTFDDFPNDNTASILDTLDKFNIKATFFLCKSGNPERYALYERIRDSGHDLANHSSSHDRKTMFKDSVEFLAAFARMELFLNNLGVESKFIRIPYGSADPYNYELRRYGVKRLRNLGYTIVDWTASIEDSYTYDPNILMRNLKETCTEDREIILMHHLSQTAMALPDMLQWLIDEGYAFEKVSDAPDLYSAIYRWEPNINKNGSDTSTADKISTVIYPNGLNT